MSKKERKLIVKILVYLLNYAVPKHIKQANSSTDYHHMFFELEQMNRGELND